MSVPDRCCTREAVHSHIPERMWPKGVDADARCRSRLLSETQTVWHRGCMHVTLVFTEVHNSRPSNRPLARANFQDHGTIHKEFESEVPKNVYGGGELRCVTFRLCRWHYSVLQSPPTRRNSVGCIQRRILASKRGWMINKSHASIQECSSIVLVSGWRFRREQADG